MCSYSDSDSEVADVPALVHGDGGKIEPEVIGVTLIAGFLGSGKSTLVRRLLTENHGLKLLVVENEFGDRVSSSIETAVVTAPSGDGSDASALAELVELPNGCVCCAASHDLTSSLARLLRADGPRRFDHIVIEASGLADPGPVAAAFWVDEELESMLRLDGIITVVDSVFLATYLDVVEGRNSGSEVVDVVGEHTASVKRELLSEVDENRAGLRKSDAKKARLAEKQIAVADAILLNKIDLLDGCSTALENARGLLNGRRSVAASVYETVRCNVPFNKILGLNAYDRARCQRLLESDVYSGSAVHPAGVGAISLVFEDVEFDRRKLDHVYGQLLWEKHNHEDQFDIWRAKALVAIQGEPCPVLYQAVHTLFEGEATDQTWNESSNRVSKFVFIGRGLIEHMLRNAILSAAVGTDCSTSGR